MAGADAQRFPFIYRTRRFSYVAVVGGASKGLPCSLVRRWRRRLGFIPTLTSSIKGSHHWHVRAARTLGSAYTSLHAKHPATFPCHPPDSTTTRPVSQPVMAFRNIVILPRLPYTCQPPQVGVVY